MCRVSFPRPFKTGRCVAVHTAESAGIVHPDITAGDTATGRALGRVLPVCNIHSENFLNQAVIDAFSGQYIFGTDPLVFRTGAEIHSVCRGRGDHGFNEPIKFLSLLLIYANAFFFPVLEVVPLPYDTYPQS